MDKNRRKRRKDTQIIVKADPDYLNKLDLKENERIKIIFYNEILIDIKKDINKGEYVKKKPYPDKYRKSHGVDNLFVYDIGNTHRIVYTIRTDESTKIYQFLDLLTHKEYDILFGYKTS